MSKKVEVLVELRNRDDIIGTIDVSISPETLSEKSIEAVDYAMESVNVIAGKAINTVRSIPVTERPSEMEIEFGLKLTTDAKALIVNAGIEAHFVVKLKWLSTS